MSEGDLLIFKTIFEQSPISTQIFSPDGETLMVNSAWEELWKIKFKQLKSYNVLKDKQLVKTGIMPFIKRGFKGEVIRIPAIRYEPSQTVDVKGAVPYRWLQARMFPIKDENGKITHLVLQHEDITDIKESEERFRTILNAASDAIALSDGNGKVIDFNPAYLSLYGLKENEVKGKNFSVIFPKKIREWAMQEYKRMFDAKTIPGPVEAEVVRGDGTRLSVESKYDFILDKGKRVAMVSIVRDITERKNIDRQKDDFMGIVSHELRTPVTSLKAYTQVLLKKLDREKDSGTLSFLSKMDTQINKLTTIISDLLDITKLEGGLLHFRKESYELDPLIEEVVDVIQRIAEDHKIEIKGKTGLKLTGDRERTGQVLTNLLTNAVKYSPNAKKIIVSTKIKEKFVYVSVQDFGVGIPKGMQDRIFSKFIRVMEQRGETYPGLGLGLYISSQIIKKQGGKIWVESSPGKGSTFHFCLPIK